MRRKPWASHCVKKPPPEVYRPERWVFFSGAQVLRISSWKVSLGSWSSTSCSPSMRKVAGSPLTITRVTVMSSPSRRSGWAV